MRTVNSKKAFCLFRHPSSNSEAKQSLSWLISCRLLLLFSLACAAGVFCSFFSNATTVHNELMRAYFASFSPNSISSWITNSIRNSAFDISILSALWLSAMTFFCPAAVHLLILLSGLTYGICIGIITGGNFENPHFAFVYIIATSVWAIFIARWSASLLRFNRQCIATRENHVKGKSLYVSPLLKQYLRQGLAAILFLLTYRLTFSFAVAFILILL